jgi:hypothetical protein
MEYKQRNYGGPTLEDTMALQNYQDKLKINSLSSTRDVSQMASQYYSILENYLNPSNTNLELAQNIPSSENFVGNTAKGQPATYSNFNGDGYIDNLGYLGNNTYPPVEYGNDRAAELSNCAKDLPMFAASSLLPKPSTNADNMALSHDAARALSAFTALSPVEQIGGITSIKTPYSRLTDIRAIDPINQSRLIDVPFNGSSSYGTTTTFGSINSYGQYTPNGLVKL